MVLGGVPPPIVDYGFFRFIGALEVRKATRLQYPLSLLTILLTPNADRRRVAESIGRVIRCTDVMSPHPERPGFQVLLIDASRNDVNPVIRRIQDAAPQGDVFDHRVTSFPATAASVQQLLAP